MPDAGRVVTGAAKGLRLRAPGAGTRPLTDRLKQALFASLEVALDPDWPVPFLDLFAGSGAAGIEALSRGAPRVILVERDAGAARVIDENLRRSGLQGARVVRRDVAAVLREGSAALGGPFGAVLVDPPYGESRTLNVVLDLLGQLELGWLTEAAVVVAKHAFRDAAPEEVEGLSVRRRRRFGDSALTYYRRHTPQEIVEA